jgi:uncharacterized protein YjiS (DUF1127 family)
MSTDLRLVVPGRPRLRRGQSFVRELARQADRVIAALLRWQELARQRRALLHMDDHMLKDIGLSRADAVREAERPFWDEGSGSWQTWR